jgi:phospho-N-acetylmuramoyl-pentapeptide-transferase
MILNISQIAVVFLTAFAVVVITGPAVIRFLTKLKMRQPIGADSPQPLSHQKKQGTPTMGGILFCIGVFASILVGFATGWLPLDGPSIGRLTAVVMVFTLHLALGFVDDYLKANRGKALGLKAREKLAGQVVIATLFVVYLAFTPVPAVQTAISFWPEHQVVLPPGVYYTLVVFLMVGLSNGANLTDGLDGLAAGLSVLALIGLSLTTFAGAPEVAFFGWALSGACLGFLVYNGNPARVFMGDTGSLALGASAAAIAVMGKQEIAVFIFFGVFIMEMLSVVIQVISFKSTGKRVFKMAPVHHHFELLGWTEVQVIQRFWIAGAVALWLGLIVADSISPFMMTGITR